MTNGEKFVTAQERADAFRCLCNRFVYGDCSKCKAFDKGGGNIIDCVCRWLDLEAEEEKPLPCPFCGGECKFEVAYVRCSRCNYTSKASLKREDAIAAHNRVAKKCSYDKERLDSAEKVVELAGCLTNMSIIDAVHYKATHASMKYENGHFLTIEDPVASKYKLIEEQMIPVFKMLKEAVADYNRVAKKCEVSNEKLR